MIDHQQHSCRKGQGGGHSHNSHGPTSAWMHDPKTVLEKIPLLPGQVMVDLGCGAGDYAIEASAIVGESGRVFALDNWPYLIDNLKRTSDSPGRGNITPLLADITGPLPLDDASADMVFIATVLHIFNLKRTGPALFSEVFRILKPGGCLAVVECKKEDYNFGPPRHMRQSPEEIEDAVRPHGFERTGCHDLGYNYLILFLRNEAAE